MVSEESVNHRNSSSQNRETNSHSTIPLNATAVYGVQRVEANKNGTATRKPGADVPVIQPGPPQQLRRHYGNNGAAPRRESPSESLPSCSDGDTISGPPLERPPPPPISASKPSANLPAQPKNEPIYRSMDKNHRANKQRVAPAPPQLNSLEGLGDSIQTTPRSGRRIYTVEEPPSSYSTGDRRDHRALVRRITNDMQMAQYMEQKKNGPLDNGNVNGALMLAEATKKRRRRRKYEVYRIRAFRLAELGFRRALWYLGKAAAAHKMIFTMLPIILLMFTFVGPVIYRNNLNISPPFSNFVVSNDPIRSFDYSQQQRYLGMADPDGGPIFNGTNPNFDAIRRNSLADFAMMLKIGNQKKSILEEKALETYLNLRHDIEMITVPTTITGGKPLRWPELCRTECAPLDLTINKMLQGNSKTAVTFPETLVPISGSPDSNQTRLFLGFAIGGVETDRDGAIIRASAFAQNVHLRANYKPTVTEHWQLEFQKQMTHDRPRAEANASVKLFWWSYRDFLDTVTHSLTEAHKCLGAVAGTLVLLCIFCSFAADGYQSKPLLGLITGVILLVSCIGGYSVQMAGIGGRLNALVFPVCFVLIGIGILLLFALATCWSKYGNAAAHPTEKIAFLLSWDAPCTLITALLIIICYISGATTGIPYLQYVFFVLAAGLAVLLIFTLLFFTVMMYVVGRRETKGVKWYQCCRTGDTQFAAPLLKEYSDNGLAMLHEKLVDMKQSVSRRIGELMVTEGFRYPIVFIYTVYMIFAIWGVLMTRIDLREEHFLPGKSEPRLFLENYRQMFGRYEEYLELIVDEQIEYHDPKLRQDLAELLESAIQSGFATRSVNWLADFSKFEQLSIYDVNAETFVPVVHHIFLATDTFKKYATDLIFDKYQTQIVASRFYLELSTKGVQERVFLVNEILARARRANIPLTVKAPFVFLLQHDTQVFRATVFAFAIVLSLLTLLSLMLFGCPALTITLALGDLSVIVGVIGYAIHWSIPINVLTISMALSGNALTTAIVVHFCYHFANAGPRQKSGQKRVEYAFQSCLIPVTLACLFPLISYTPLFLIEAPIILHMWKILALTCAASLAHFLFFIPGLMIFFTELVPRCCTRMVSGCEQCCCYCCEMEEDSGSIYYIPTAGRPIPVDTMHRMNGGPYPAIEHYSLAGRRPMLISTAPPGYLAIAAPTDARNGGTTVLVPDVLPYHHDQSASDIYRGRRRRHHSERSSASSSQPELHTPRALRRCERLNHMEGGGGGQLPASGTESIYEEPPSSDGGSRRLRRNSIGSRPAASSTDRRSRSDRVSETDTLKKNNASGGGGTGGNNAGREMFDDRNHQGREPAIEMTPNWRQYLIEGSIRHHPASLHHAVPAPQMLYYGAPPTVFAVPDYSTPIRDRRRY